MAGSVAVEASSEALACRRRLPRVANERLSRGHRNHALITRGHRARPSRGHRTPIAHLLHEEHQVALAHREL